MNKENKTSKTRQKYDSLACDAPPDKSKRLIHEIYENDSKSFSPGESYVNTPSKHPFSYVTFQPLEVTLPY